MGHTISYCEEKPTGSESRFDGQRRYGNWMRVETPRKSERNYQRLRREGKNSAEKQMDLWETREKRAQVQTGTSMGQSIPTDRSMTLVQKHIREVVNEDRIGGTQDSPSRTNISYATKGSQGQVPPLYHDSFLRLAPQLLHQPNNIQIIQSIAMYHTDLGPENIIAMPITYLVQYLRSLKSNHISSVLDQIFERADTQKNQVPPGLSLHQSQLMSYAPHTLDSPHPSMKVDSDCWQNLCLKRKAQATLEHEEKNILEIDREPNTPWCLIGDFNPVRNAEEKEGNLPPNPRSMRMFNNFIMDARLMDIPFKGANFTWSNNQEGNAEVKQRLDRALGNIGWLSRYPDSYVTHGARTESDHCPITMRVEDDRGRRGRRRFFYEKGWMEAAGYRECVERSWNIGLSSNKNLKMLEKNLSVWKRETIGVNKEKINNYLEELKNLESLPRTEMRQREEKRLREELSVCWKIEENYWAQRARTTWLKLGDKNTSFFHASTVQRRRRNNISRLQSENGDWIEENMELMNHITNFYKELFKGEK
ncbi:hypothetical protein LINPERHAP1_LOCUS25043 [Linum perenne]